jgi:hypothetical protein
MTAPSRQHVYPVRMSLPAFQWFEITDKAVS